MPKFGAVSEAQLATIHPRLVLVLREGIKVINFSVVEGHRGQVAQDKAFAKGLSKVKWPNGKHNKKPSKAADVAPYPLDWSNRPLAHFRFVLVMGVLLACAHRLGVKVRLGMDWNRNLDPRDERFIDLPHIELDE